jgi:hypothetical protein
MSRSNPIIINPATRKFEWAASLGKLRYYDRETRETHEVPLPFRFMVLDQLSTITGYNKPEKSNVWSNEVRNTKVDTLFVRMKSGPLEAGLYSELAQTPRRGGKFAKAIYIAFYDTGNWKIGKLVVSGSALIPWFEFTKSHSVDTGAVTLTCGTAQDGIGGTYYSVDYKWEKCQPGEDDVAVVLDKQLQTYLDAYLSAPKVDEDGQGTPEPGLATPEQQADYEARKAAASTSHPAPTKQNDDLIIEDLEDEPINLDDIPF